MATLVFRRMFSSSPRTFKTFSGGVARFLQTPEGVIPDKFSPGAFAPALRAVLPIRPGKTPKEFESVRMPPLPALVDRGFTRNEYETRFRRAQALMEAHKVDAVLITTEESFEYFSGLHTQFWRSPTRPYFLVLPREGDTPIAVIPSISLLPMQETWVSDISSWAAPCPEDDGVTLLTQALLKVPAKHNKIGMPMSHETSLRMPLLDFFRVQENIKAQGKDFTDASTVVRSTRNIKSEAEIDKIRAAAVRTSKAFGVLPSRVAALRGKVTDRDLTREMRKELVRQGLDDVPYIIGESGTGGYVSIVTGPTDRGIATGDIVVFDTGSRFDGYFCDFSRNFSVGGPPSEVVAKVHDMLWVATQKGIEAARPGNKMKDIFFAMANSLEEQSGGVIDSKKFSTGRMGHGLGRNLTEWPSVTPYEEVVIEEGMVLSVEPGTSLEPFTGEDKILVHEENIVIRKNGAELLTPRAPREMPVLYLGSNPDPRHQDMHPYKLAMVKTTAIPNSAHEISLLNSTVHAVRADTVEILKQYQSMLPAAQMFHDNHPEMKETPLYSLPVLASSLDVSEILVKDEGERFGLQAFKGVGVCYAIHRLINDGKILRGSTITTMTDGNHGRAVARFARENGCKSVIYVPTCMSAARRANIEKEGGEVVVVKGTYDDSIEIMRQNAEKNNWQIISDTAWEGYTEVPMDIMVGYGTIFREVEDARIRNSGKPISHVLLQAGVGGFAGAGLAYIGLSASEVWGQNVRIIIVEPSSADCVMHNIINKNIHHDRGLQMATGSIESVMSGLNCGMPSAVAWPLLRDLPASYMAIGDEWAHTAMRLMHKEGVISGESGAAGVGGLVAIRTDRTALLRHSRELGFGPESVVLCINTEGATDPESFRRVVGDVELP